MVRLGRESGSRREISRLSSATHLKRERQSRGGQTASPRETERTALRTSAAEASFKRYPLDPARTAEKNWSSSSSIPTSKSSAPGMPWGPASPDDDAGMESARITSQFDSFISVLGVADGEPCPTIETSDGLRNNRSKVSRNNRFPTNKKMRTALAAVSLFTRSIQKHTSSRKKCFSAHTREETKTPRSIGSRQRVATPFGSPKLVLRLFLCQEAIALRNVAECN